MYISSVILPVLCPHYLNRGPVGLSSVLISIQSVLTSVQCQVIFNVVKQHVQLSHGFVQAFAPHLNTKHTLNTHLLLTHRSVMIMHSSCTTMFKVVLTLT